MGIKYKFRTELGKNINNDQNSYYLDNIIQYYYNMGTCTNF